MNARDFIDDLERTLVVWGEWKHWTRKKNARCVSSFLVCKLSWLLEMSNQAFLQRWMFVLFLDKRQTANNQKWLSRLWFDHWPSRSLKIFNFNDEWVTLVRPEWKCYIFKWTSYVILMIAAIAYQMLLLPSLFMEKKKKKHFVTSVWCEPRKCQKQRPQRRENWHYWWCST